jgi:hypothetical protein
MRWSRIAAWALALPLAAAFLALAALRRLNFDEALALRAGGLELAHAHAAPAFVMPLTLAFGAAGRWIADPGTLFLVLRLTVAAGLLALLVAAFVALGLGGARLAVAIAFTLCQASFVTHALEFRYDAAILCALLLLAIALGRRSRPRPWLAGAAVAVLTLHHLKGLFLAALLVPWVVLRLRSARGGTARWAGGVAATLALWSVVLGGLGLGERWLETLRQFVTLAGNVTRVPFQVALGPAMTESLAWWAIALWALVVTLWRRGVPEDTDGSSGTALALAAAALVFVLVHPHPWPYMLALPAPFLAAIVAGRLPSLGGGARRVLSWVACGVVAVAVQAVATGRPPWDPWTRALAAPRAPEVATLRRLRAASGPGDRVLDPSGLVYFLPPCSEDWYTDTLFAERAAAGRWMQALASGIPADCTCALHTYRLGALPAAARDDLQRDFVLLASGVALRRGDPRLAKLAEPVPGLSGRIESFW